MQRLPDWAVLLHDSALCNKGCKGQCSRSNQGNNGQEFHPLLNANLKDGQDVDDVEIAMGDGNEEDPAILI